MNEPDIGHKEYTGFPFGMSKSTYEHDLRSLTVAELEDSLEIKRWLLIDPATETTSATYFFEHMITAIVSELERRRALLKTQANHPHAPKWKHGTMVANRDRIERVKARWPIDVFVEQSLGCKLKRYNSQTSIGRCPLPHHHDEHPSFKVNREKGYAWCFGCQRGGDVIELTRWYLNGASFMEALEALEKEGAIFDARQ